MRKALMSMMLAATVLSPAAAQAQGWRGGDRGGHTRDQNGGDEGRAARSEQRQQQREVQQTPPVQQQVQQPEQQQQAPVVRTERVRDNDGNTGGNRNWRGNNDGNGGSDAANTGGNRNWRGNNDGNGGNAAANTGGNRNWRGNNNDGNSNQAGRDRNNDGNRRNWSGAGGGTSSYPQAWQGNPNDPRMRHYQDLEQRNQQRYSNDNRRGDWNGNRNGRNDWNRNWRNDNRYDWQRWRNTNRNIFHVGRYYSPYRNYGYNRFDIGFFLEPLFYSQNFWIGDPWQYRLPPAYPGTQWVRYYNDVLLVDIYTGQVVDVIYGFFW